MRNTRPKFSDERLKDGPQEGWCYLFGGSSAHYFRLDRSLCRKYQIAPTTKVHQVPLRHVHRTCPGCLRLHSPQSDASAEQT